MTVHVNCERMVDENEVVRVITKALEVYKVCIRYFYIGVSNVYLLVDLLVLKKMSRGNE